MAYPTVDTYFSKRYNKEYDLVYGQKRLNTGYEFNAETTNVLGSFASTPSPPYPE